MHGISPVKLSESLILSPDGISRPSRFGRFVCGNLPLPPRQSGLLLCWFNQAGSMELSMIRADVTDSNTQYGLLSKFIFAELHGL